MPVKSKSECIQKVKMFDIFLLESLDASCKDYVISSVGTLSYDWPKTNFARSALECKQKLMKFECLSQASL